MENAKPKQQRQSRPRSRSVSAPPKGPRSNSKVSNPRLTRLRRDIIADTIHAIFTPFTSGENSVALTLILLISAGLVVLHAVDPTDSWIVSIGDSLSTGVLKPLGVWIKTYPDKLLGLVALIPAVAFPPRQILLSNSPDDALKVNNPLILFVFFSIPIFFLKAYTIFDYCIYSLGVFLVIHLTTNTHRVFVVIGVAIFWIFANSVSKPKTSQTAASDNG